MLDKKSVCGISVTKIQVRSKILGAVCITDTRHQNVTVNLKKAVSFRSRSDLSSQVEHEHGNVARVFLKA